jgi:nitroreductase
VTIAYGPDAAAGDALLSALRNRRTCRSFTGDPVPRRVIEAMLEAARWAPNHRLTNPWRFFVVEKAGAVRQQIARLVHDWTYEYVKNPSPERRTQSADAAQREILDAPALLYAFAAPGADEEITAENYAATCCAVQNLQLAAYAYGVAVGWSTGKPAKPAGLPAVLGADPSWRLVGALFAGYPAQVLRQERKPVADITTWR